MTWRVWTMPTLSFGSGTQPTSTKKWWCSNPRVLRVVCRPLQTVTDPNHSWMQEIIVWRIMTSTFSCVISTSRSSRHWATTWRIRFNIRGAPCLLLDRATQSMRHRIVNSKIHPLHSLRGHLCCYLPRIMNSLLKRKRHYSKGGRSRGYRRTDSKSS